MDLFKKTNFQDNSRPFKLSYYGVLILNENRKLYFKNQQSV